MACAESVAKSKKTLNHQGTKEAFLSAGRARKKLCVSVSLWFPSFQGLLRQPPSRE